MENFDDILEECMKEMPLTLEESLSQLLCFGEVVFKIENHESKI